MAHFRSLWIASSSAPAGRRVARARSQLAAGRTMAVSYAKREKKGIYISAPNIRAGPITSRKKKPYTEREHRRIAGVFPLASLSGATSPRPRPTTPAARPPRSPHSLDPRALRNLAKASAPYLHSYLCHISFIPRR